MRKVKIDMGELIDAFENCAIEQNYFLDLESGEITFVSEYSLTEEEKEEIYEDIDSNQERYLAIPERDSHRAAKPQPKIKRLIGRSPEKSG